MLNGREKSNGLKEYRKETPQLISQNIIVWLRNSKLCHFQTIPIMIITKKIESLAEPCNFIELISFLRI